MVGEYHHFGCYRNSLLIGLIPLSNSLSTSQRDSTKTEIEHIFNGCYCPLDRVPSPHCSLQWSDCSGPILFPSLMSVYCNELLSLPPMVQSHLLFPWMKPPPTTSRVLTPTHIFVTEFHLTYSENDAWWS